MPAHAVNRRQRRGRGAELPPAVRTETDGTLQVGATTIAKHVSPPDPNDTEVSPGLFSRLVAASGNVNIAQAVEEVGEQLGLEVSYETDLYFVIDYVGDAA